MPSGGNKFEKYKNRRKVSGRMALDSQQHEDCLHLIAEGNSKEAVTEMLGITAEEIETLLASPLGQRRFQFISQEKARADYEPSSPDECLSYVKQRLVKLSKEGEDKVKIEALKSLARVAIDERENQPAKAAGPVADSADLEKLSKAFGGKASE